MIPEDAFRRLSTLEGKLSEHEGRRLADLAGAVSVEHTIVEVGSFKGKSACYLGVGSKHGSHAPVYAVDLWELHEWDQYASRAVFAKWREQVAQMNVDDIVTPIRCESSVMGKLFGAPIGLLFIDGNHAFESVERDFHAWQRHVIPGGVVAFHDYDNPKYGIGVRKFVDAHVAPSSEWCSGKVVDSMYVTRRAASGNGEKDRLTFVSNDELEDHLKKRPPQYALDLSLVVPRRDANGIYIDTHSPHYAPLKSKYQESSRCLPLVARIDAMCRNCPVGATCSFPRLSPSRRQAVLNSKDRAEWCATKCWGSEVDFVYPYVDGPARGDELKYSIRSVEQHFLGTPRIWVIGDKPDWYHGNYIRHQRLSSRRHLPRLDRAAKLQRIVKESAIDSQFVWMMDDVYFLQPVTLQDLRRRWKRAEMNTRRLARYKPKNVWQNEKRMTWQALSEAGRPLDDVASHMPVVYEKDKLRQLFRKYKLHKQPLVDDLLYLNEFATYAPQHFDEVLYCERGRPPAQKIRDRARSALIMNHVDGGYTAAMESVLQEMFPEPSNCERE